MKRCFPFSEAEDLGCEVIVVFYDVYNCSAYNAISGLRHVAAQRALWSPQIQDGVRFPVRGI